MSIRKGNLFRDREALLAGSGGAWLGAPSSKCGWASGVVAAAWSPPADRIARHTRSGVHGIWMSWIPSGRNASTTALTTAGVEAIVPASPTPLVPNVLVVEGDVVFSVTNEIVSAAVGRV